MLHAWATCLDMSVLKYLLAYTVFNILLSNFFNTFIVDG